MVVQHNMQAMNANRMLNITTGSQAKSTEKLSSGYRINRAADDAAGLSISEKMRKQMRGLDRASTNAQDGVSAVQTAEGALTEVHSMLQRMNELATQAANGTNSETDRQSIQDEIDQLTTEIDRVAETTKFNETYLLKGNAEGKSSEVKVAAHDAGFAGKLTDNGDGTSTFKLSDELKNGSKITIAGQEYEIGQTKSVTNYATTASIQAMTLSAGDSVSDGTTTKTLTDDVDVVAIAQRTLTAGDKITLKDGTVYTCDGTNWKDEASNTVSATDLTLAKGAGNVFYNATTGKSHTIVNALEVGDVSTFGKTAASLTATQIASGTDNGTTSFTIAEGNTVTINGKQITAHISTHTAAAFSAIQDGIMGTNAGKTVTITSIDGNTSKTYTIAETAEEAAKLNKANKTDGYVTREEVISKISEGDRVEYADKTDAVQKVTAAGVDAADENTITVDTAYKMIADELTKASSIGTDDGKGAKVTDKGNGVFEIKQGSVEVKDALSFNLHVGADADTTNKISVNVDAMSSAGLGIKGLNVKDDTGVAATYAIDAISDAISKVSSQRSALGAVQNRLEHTIANVDNVVENTTSAESRIRDTDMASEMVEYSKNNILAQAGQSMLAQANQSNQGVLSLLG